MGIMHLLGMHSLSKIGSARLFALMEAFGDYEAAWENFDEWPRILGINVDYAELKREYNRVDVEALYENFLLSDAKLVTVNDPGYPERLRNIPDPPYALFYRGELPAEDETAVAIVGSRRATAYGREAAAYFANGLAKCGTWVVGGMARGIDSAAHQAALDAGGKTLGVLGCGIDVVYPPENAQLYQAAVANGCLVSEYPMGMKPLGRNFPIRNRVISGFSDAVLVVEAGTHSGTQITVNYAELQGRQIYAVPGSIFSQFSSGTNGLIRSGKAAIAGSAADILADLTEAAENGKPHAGQNIEKKYDKKKYEKKYDKRYEKEAVKKTDTAPKQLAFGDLSAALPQMPLPQDEQSRRLVEFVTEQKHFNDIARELDMAAPELAGVLTLLEIDGFIKRLDGQYYIRSQT